LETMRLRGRPRNRWQDEVREDGRLVGGKGWKERLFNREEWRAPEKGKELSHSAHAKGMNNRFNFKKPAYVTDKMVNKAFCDDIMSRPHTPEGYSTFKDGHTSMEDLDVQAAHH